MNRQINRLEELPSEIIIQIFQNMSFAYDLYSSFFNLNSRFNSLLNYFGWKIDLTDPNLKQTRYTYLCLQVIPTITPANVTCLKISTDNLLGCARTYFKFNQFINLTTLTLICCGDRREFLSVPFLIFSN
ncbi:unnamed protein product [Didymodactylos carnosus]|uniref:F-box domain-containing protein n=1 Tax=Didymodactylos carnosus TaxID=1234261 RepID=A0A813VX74_9BILA|nr:unnamed protein product [Didymodactylos carnosus]CAF1038467.1 unnamed protein product [Didymodactylos carnosus]CAF3635354.1 unnamed protein product [Didymodactylos carnosus]CAF3806606.1 unnamed protein product [Didymodactylos carnosus]